MPTAEEVADRARRHSERGKDWGVGMCLKFSRSCALAPGGVLDAITAWRRAEVRHASGVAPRGAIVFWEGGSARHGHVAVSDGRGFVWSTDISRRGKVDRFGIAALGARWPNLDYLGWTEDVNGVFISGLSATLKQRMVELRNLRPGLANSDVKRFQVALRLHGQARLNPSGATGFYGTETIAMCRSFQQKQGFTGSDADGAAGPKTCALLGLPVM